MDQLPWQPAKSVELVPVDVESPFNRMGMNSTPVDEVAFVDVWVYVKLDDKTWVYPANAVRSVTLAAGNG